MKFGKIEEYIYKVSEIQISCVMQNSYLTDLLTTKRQTRGSMLLRSFTVCMFCGAIHGMCAKQLICPDCRDEQAVKTLTVYLYFKRLRLYVAPKVMNFKFCFTRYGKSLQPNKI